MPTSTEIAVAAGLLMQDGRVLVCQRALDGRHPGKWEFPGGKVEAGETIAECLRRELREELAIEAEPGDEVWRTRHRYADDLALTIVFLRVRSFSGTPVNRCFANMEWAALAGLAGYDFLAADREFVEMLSRGEVVLEWPCSSGHE